MDRHRFLALLAPLAGLLFLPGAGGRLAAQEEPGKFAGEIQVREIGLLVEPPESGSFKAADLLVFDGGAPRQVLKAEPLRPEGSAVRPWTVVLYFDRALSRPDAIRGAALAFAKVSRELTGLGTVEVTLADPEPRVALAATADARSLSD